MLTTVRTYVVESPAAIGKRLGELRTTYPFVAIERVLRGGKLLEPVDNLVVQAHDAVALYGSVARLANVASRLGPEIPETLPESSARRPSTSWSTRVG